MKTPFKAWLGSHGPVRRRKGRISTKTPLKNKENGDVKEANSLAVVTIVPDTLPL
jgi:hypothetical protein